MKCTRCHVDNYGERDRCFNCGEPLTGEPDRPAPNVFIDENGVGFIKKAWRSSGEYYSLFFYPESIVIITHGSISSKSAGGALLKTILTQSRSSQVQNFGSKKEMVNQFGTFLHINKTQIGSIGLYKKFTESQISINIPTPDGKWQIYEYSFPKKEFDNVNQIMTQHFADKLLK
jgi:hypothetical protein